MEYHHHFLIAYTHTMLAFVAFTAIVASVRSSTGGHLTAIQYLLLRFFVETGLIHVAEALTALGLFAIGFDADTVWRWTTYATLAAVVLYLPFYFMRRVRISAPFPFVSRVVTVGYGIGVLLLTLTAFEVFWSPSAFTAIMYFLWALVSSVAVFFSVLGSYIEVSSPDAAGSSER